MEEFNEVYYRGIPCYYNIETRELIGRNKFYDFLVEICLWWDSEILNKDEVEVIEYDEFEFEADFNSEDEEDEDTHK